MKWPVSACDQADSICFRVSVYIRELSGLVFEILLMFSRPWRKRVEASEEFVDDRSLAMFRLM
jgi:hypothetical protein